MTTGDVSRRRSPPQADGGGESTKTARAPGVAASDVAGPALALMTASSVASLRPAPTMGGYGLAGVFLYVLPAIVFLIPTEIVFLIPTEIENMAIVEAQFLRHIADAARTRTAMSGTPTQTEARGYLC